MEKLISYQRPLLILLIALVVVLPGCSPKPVRVYRIEDVVLTRVSVDFDGSTRPVQAVPAGPAYGNLGVCVVLSESSKHLIARLDGFNRDVGGNAPALIDAQGVLDDVVSVLKRSFKSVERARRIEEAGRSAADLTVLVQFDGDVPEVSTGSVTLGLKLMFLDPASSTIDLVSLETVGMESVRVFDGMNRGADPAQEAAFVRNAVGSGLRGMEMELLKSESLAVLDSSKAAQKPGR